MRIPIAITLIVALSSCSPIPMIALSDDDWRPTSEMPVKGRSGFFIRQKLAFGEYRTGPVARSWAKGSNWRAEGSFPNDWLDRIAVEWVRRKQTVRFALTDDQGRVSQVTALARVQWRDLQIGGNPTSLTNIMGGMLRVGDEANDTYAVRIFTDRQEEPWEMLIDNYAARRYAKSYIGLLARNSNEYYTVVPVYKLRNPRGEAVDLPFGGSVGFEFKNREGKILAAVSLIGNGAVYLGECSDEEKFLLANASAALLLQQLLDEGVR
jgi:hypothetical protein